jgi:Cof subfamily protein (haloacid dehalogenase superfamily)
LKTLYISDLDGTLLNSKQQLSEYTKNTLNKLITKGMNFSVATARNTLSALDIIKDAKINNPIILMNGVCIYDIKEKKYINIEYIPKASFKRILELLRKHNLSGSLFSIQDNIITNYYETPTTPDAKDYYKERVTELGKKVTNVKSFSECVDMPLVYFSINHNEELLHPFFEDVKNDKNINVEYYHDVYRDGKRYLEICSAKASKFTSVEFIRNNYNFDEVVCFGDNLNDIPMFLQSDRCYAVANARDELKERANEVIGFHCDDAVAKWLEENAVY